MLIGSEEKNNIMSTVIILLYLMLFLIKMKLIVTYKIPIKHYSYNHLIFFINLLKKGFH